MYLCSINVFHLYANILIDMQYQIQSFLHLILRNAYMY